jgi:hypothetical protein
MIDVPSKILLVCAAAAARIVSESPALPPDVSHAAGTPAASAFMMLATVIAGSAAGIATPIVLFANLPPPGEFARRIGIEKGERNVGIITRAPVLASSNDK